MRTENEVPVSAPIASTPEPAEPELQQIKALALAATPQNFDSWQVKSEGGEIECPACGGEGTVERGNDYCNYDKAALGVTFYGIGEEHRNAEAYYRAVRPAVVLDLIARIGHLNEALKLANDCLAGRPPALLDHAHAEPTYTGEQMYAAGRKAALDEAIAVCKADRAWRSVDGIRAIQRAGEVSQGAAPTAPADGNDARGEA